MHGYRKGQNPVGKAFRGFGKALSEGMEALAEAAERDRERAALAEKIELEQRAFVETALSQYEKHVGRPYQLDSRFTTAKIAEPISGYNTGLPWDPENKGHLITCRNNCVTDHCITCGMESYGRVYCYNHRP